MAAHESGTESITLGREMGGDKGKDIHRDTVDESERVPPFLNGDQCCCSVPVKSRNGVQGETGEEVSTSFLVNLSNFLDSCWRVHHTLQLLVESKDKL